MALTRARACGLCGTDFIDDLQHGRFIRTSWGAEVLICGPCEMARAEKPVAEPSSTREPFNLWRAAFLVLMSVLIVASLVAIFGGAR